MCELHESRLELVAPEKAHNLGNLARTSTPAKMQSASTPCIILATSARIALMIVRLHALLFQKPSKHVNSQLEHGFDRHAGPVNLQWLSTWHREVTPSNFITTVALLALPPVNL